MDRISAIVLAAGLSRRMGRNKLILPFRGKPLLSHTLELIDALPFGEKILVTTKDTAGAVAIPPGFSTVINENPEEGQSSSLRLGVSAVALDHYMFFPGDMPFLDRAAALEIADEAEDGLIVIPEAEGKPASPVIFPKFLREELLALSGDEGGRQLFSAYDTLCKRIRPRNPGALRDIDTPEDFSALGAGLF